jgi:hypothetical protein
MQAQLIAIVAAVLLLGCGESQQSATPAETKPVEPVAETAKPEPPTAKAPDIPLWEAAMRGNIEAVKQHLDAGADVNVKDDNWGATPLHLAAAKGYTEIAEGAEVDPNIQAGPKGVLRSGINTRTDKEINT